MFGRLKLLAAGLLPLCCLSAQQGSQPAPQIPKETLAEMAAQYRFHTQQAVQMNELAGKLQSPEDARRLVDTIATIFADDLPPKWVTRKLRHQLAMAEFQSATDPEMLIPEEQIADAWNRYVVEIGAPQEALVNAAEIHYLRDAYYVTARMSWNLGNQNIWTIPNIYAVGPDGKINRDSRAIEALRIVWDLANHFDNLRGAREAVKKGLLLSDRLDPAQVGPGTMRARVVVHSGVSGVSGLRGNPVEAAEIQYTRERGEAAMAHAIVKLIDDVLPQHN
jgi:hypothetical protein